MYALTNCKVFTGSDVLTNHAVLIDGEDIHSIVPDSELSSSIERVDLNGANLSLVLLICSLTVVAV
ncbi:N-acetylglucosamine-6-phosphate deacetylase [Vibrio maritimus]|uniref:N-acetylglucosamine-6-phosphate deacetylase n=2 Tax=Vibrio TaxID=662 RepID=A0A090RW83_9VIBR|nr:N-acetylglucosamine-6-phosphate deacetylase [Vibrio maritimus]GAL24948.1 N-acetylglucosamine-6-phosphate deacetylase [Vibrio variabilis]